MAWLVCQSFWPALMIHTKERVMPLKFSEGQAFPSASLVDDRGKEVTIEEVGNHQPLILAFFRGPW